LGITNAAVSQHLQILRKGGLVTGEKRGYWTHYTVEKAVLELAAEQLKSMSILATARRSECHKLTVRPTATDNTRRKKSMCKCNCEQPDKLKESLENCSKEQIKECHADQENHPCEKPKK
jgi:predicted transcriptional regulator